MSHTVVAALLGLEAFFSPEIPPLPCQLKTPLQTRQNTSILLEITNVLSREVEKGLWREFHRKGRGRLTRDGSKGNKHELRRDTSSTEVSGGARMS
ncbi:hypothetical protein HPP92_012373 [Vanilla planifolia]|uniref:Uncharacterized protein n=1 Tax=Vanilla planifolia TaxID=51239 RepID=A0A835UVR9_VANPL|nr:hypothetical protein HPP92_012373 [Vanilla planifolia]